MKNLEKRIKKIIQDKLDVPKEKILNYSSFKEDLGADSLDIVELIMAFEEEFNIEISDKEAEKINTIEQFIEYMEKYKNKL
ncbi:acyl carrier protein [Buchnera aphidicola]|uniref:Acyl carrier protein n=1 Tax=Buchnera aphidicola (Artemisaphis artemisicola) TaxID=1241836 RepID=A0A4D6XHT5_9GAMM|nr:acyl carrier protein [Buchnera aphidicola]QCI16022.1 acyl carrier protein [Buchnera aphidicola (Artemisaphis artemisicola)]